MKARIDSFLGSRYGKVVNTALYLVAAAAITALIDYITQIDMSGQPVLYATAVQIVNLILMSLRQAYFKK